MTAVLLAAGGPLLAGVPAAQASPGDAQQHSAVAGSASLPPLAISITGLTPKYPGPDSTVTVVGTLANHSGSAQPDVAVQALTSQEWFEDPAQMTEFTDDPSSVSLQSAGNAYQAGSVPNGATVRWSAQFPAADFYNQFGVFPLEVEASDGSGDTAIAQTFVPFWPGNGAVGQPRGLQVAWVWPLIDTPQQGVCPQTLATNRLASSVASGGRLSTLLDAGSSSAGQDDDVTWDIDPALLSDVSVMTKPYHTSGNATCSQRIAEPASKSAGQWLSQLKTSTETAPAFLTPYANVDVAALSHSGLDSSLLASAYRAGDTVAGQILPGTFGKNGSGTGGGSVLKAAYPTDGQADAEVLTSLATYGGINTVVLGSDPSPVPTSSSGEDALARTTSGVGTNMSVLLANSRITSLLSTASASATEASQFTLTQDFLAQTAMIAAELPGASRSLVVAPPTTWDPSPAEANALLQDTQAPWLHPAGLSKLSAEAAQLPTVSHMVPKNVSGSELGAAYLGSLKQVQANVNLFQGLLYQPSAQQIDSLDAALAVTESSAWRGRGAPGGWLALGHLSAYLDDSEHKVFIIQNKNKMLLFGQSGKTPVSVRNLLGVPIQVRVTVSTPPGSQLQVGQFNTLLKVQGGQTNTVTMPLHSASIGTTTVHLQLATRSGSPLTWTGQSLSVEVTRFGRFLLIIIAGALGILVLTSAYRLRRKRLAGAKNGGTADETADTGGAG
ncbi:MAG TPA: DUF6049 family protein [Trebonia sp.]